MKKTLSDNIQSVLANKITTIGVIAFAIAGRIIQLIYFFNIRLDASHQVIATKNFVEGHGICMARAFPDDLAATVYEPLINWPPGYSLLLAPFYALFNGNYVAAGLTVSILFGITLIFVSRGILKLLDVPLYLINSYTLVAGFFTYYFYFIASSDAIAICLVMIAVYFFLSLLISANSWGKKTAWITISLLASGIIKYLFIPVVFVLPIYLLWRGFVEKKRPFKKAGLICFIILSVAFGALLAWQKTISGTAAYISEPGRGFFPDHLLAAYPFIPASFIKPETAALFLSPSTASWLYHFFQFLHVAIAGLVLIITGKEILRGRYKELSAARHYFYLTTFLALAITLLLGALSLTVEKEKFDSGHLWTYIEEARYYGLPVVMIQILVFIAFDRLRKRLTLALQIVFLFLFFLLFIETARGLIFGAKRLANLGKEEYSWQYEYRFQQYADSLIQHERKKYNFSKVVVGGPFYYMNHRVSLFSNAALLHDPATINELSSFHASEPVLLLVIIPENDLAAYQPFLSVKGKEIAGQFNGLYFYSVYVSPH